MEGPGERPCVRQSSKSRGNRWSQGLSEDEEAEGAEEAEGEAELEGSEGPTGHKGRRGPAGSVSTAEAVSSPSGGFTRRWQAKKRRGQPARHTSDDSDLDAEAQAALEQLASPYRHCTPR